MTVRMQLAILYKGDAQIEQWSEPDTLLGQNYVELDCSHVSVSDGCLQFVLEGDARRHYIPLTSIRNFSTASGKVPSAA